MSSPMCEIADQNRFAARSASAARWRNILPLPEGAAESDIKATYKDGILEIRIPVTEPAPEAEPTKIAITKA
jgi:HSP20 family protein